MLAMTLYVADDTQGLSVMRTTTTANMAAATTTHGASRLSHSRSRCKLVPSIPRKLVSVTLRVLKPSAPSYARIPLTLDLSAHLRSVSLLRPCICSTPLPPALLTRSSVNPTLGTARARLSPSAHAPAFACDPNSRAHALSVPLAL